MNDDRSPDPQAWPSWRYRCGMDGAVESRLFAGPDELAAAGLGWADSPDAARAAESPKANAPRPRPVDPSGMKRNEMFALLKSHGVAVALPISNDALRTKVREALA